MSDFTVLVPVYRGLADVQACVESVIRAAASAEDRVSLCLIDDASPEADVRAFLEALPTELSGVPITVLHNEVNGGFVATINRGMVETRGDVLWLNSDTIVAPGALAAIAAAAAKTDTATVTPLTTFGSICTIPQDLREALGPVRGVEDVDRIGRFVAEHSPRVRPSVITGVGFAMYVTRAAWEAVGPLDVRAYGSGYGEEVDFCLRASRAGYLHRVADDAFVHHAGGGSFGSEQRAAGLAASAKVLHGRYRFFRETNTAERAADPLAVTWAGLRLGLRPRDPDRPHVLQVTHSEPGELGGTESHSEILLTALEDTFDFTVAYPVESGVVLRTRWRGPAGERVEQEYLLPAASRRAIEPRDPNFEFALRSALDLFDFDAVHIQNLIGWSVGALGALEGFPGPVVMNLRDLYLACPHHWLMYRNEVNCGVPSDLAVCATCLPLTRQLPLESLVEHRDTVRELLPVIDHLVAASPDSLDFLATLYDVPAMRVAHVEHGAIIDLPVRRSEVDLSLTLHEPLRLGFMGLARKKKGIDIASWLAAELADDGIEVHCFGEVSEAVGQHVVVHGRYANDELPLLLDAAGIQVGLLVAPYAETFGHTMTESLLAGRPVIVSEFGALAERVRRDNVGWVVDAEDLEGIADLVRRIDNDRGELVNATLAAKALPIRHTRETAPEYAALYAAVPGATRERNTVLTEREERQRRELRAMATHNRQLQVSGGGDGRSGVDPNVRSELRELRRTLRSREREIERVNEAFASVRREKRALERDLTSLRNRRSVRAALRIARLLNR